MKIIGLTGGIASGKSTVLKMILDNYKINCFDCDLEAHKLLENIKIKAKIVDEFGDSVFVNNEIDRKKLGEIVFNDSIKRKRLEDIIHPEIKKMIKEIKETTIVDIPLLFETNFMELFDNIILVYVNEEIQLERLIKRNNLDLKEAKKRIDLQISLEKKKDKSDFIINNSFSIEETYEQVKEIMTKIMEG